MAKNRIANYTNVGRTTGSNLTIFTPGSSSVTLFTAGANGSKVLLIQELLATVSAIGAYYINDGSTDHMIRPNTATATGTDILDATLFPKGANAMRYINLETGWSIKFTSTTNPSNNTFLVYGEDY